MPSSYNMVSPAKDLPAELTEDHVLWKIDVGSRFLYGQPVFAGDRVLIGTDGGIFPDDPRFAHRHAKKVGGGMLCLDRKTGKTLWKMSFGPKHAWWVGHGTTSTPVVEGDRIYLVAPTGRAVCLDLAGQANGNDGSFTNEAEWLEIDQLTDADGDILWDFEFARPFGVQAHDAHSSDPLIVGDMMIFATGHAKGMKPTPAWSKQKEWQYRPAPDLMAVDKRTGELIAVDEIDVPRVFHGQWSSPALTCIDGEPIVVWGDGYGMLRGLRLPQRRDDGKPATFEQVWHYDCNPPDVRYDANGNEAPFPLHHNTEETRSVGASHVIAKPVVADGKIYIATGRDHYYGPRKRENMRGALHCIAPAGSGDITESARVWMKRMPLSQSTVSLSGGLLWIADQSGMLHCLDAATGETRWTHDLGKDVTCRSQLVADGKVYVSTDHRDLFVFAASAEKELLFQGRTDDRAATPGATDGMLIIATPKSITAFGRRGTTETAAAE